MLGLAGPSFTDSFYEENNKTPEEMLKFLLKQPFTEYYGGYDICKLSEEDFNEFAGHMLDQIKSISYKYKR